jgi:hypothetical protein
VRIISIWRPFCRSRVPCHPRADEPIEVEIADGCRMKCEQRISAPSPKLSASGTAPTIDSDWTTHLDRLGSSAFDVNPDPVLIAIEGALFRAHGFHGARLKSQSA